MLTDCPYCEAKVDGEVLASVHENGDHPPALISLLRCPSCGQALTVGQDDFGPDPDGDHLFSDPIRVWPEPSRPIHWTLPEIVRTSLMEAEKCFRASAYMATVVMCGRALEAICRHHQTKSQYLGGGLQELRDREIIDNRLFQWSQLLQRQRNIAAHATEERISKQDAEDLFDFVIAISDYIFVLNQKFEEFLKRQEKVKAAAKPKTT